MSINDQISLLRDTSTPHNSLATATQHSNYESVEDGVHNAPTDVILDEAARKRPQYLAAITATFSALAAGAVLGWTSPILPYIQNGDYHNITVTTNEMGWIGSLVPIGALVTCIPTGFLCDLIGRKKTLITLIIPFTIGWLLIITATSITMLYIGRLLNGIAVGACCVAAPLYINEIAQQEIRGTLGAYFQLMITIGILFAYIFGTCLPPILYTEVCAILPAIFVAVFVFQPETPVYLIRKKRHQLGLESLMKLRGVKFNCRREFEEIENLEKANLETVVSFRDTLKRKSVLKALLIALALMFFQQFSGINAVILYTSDIFTSANIEFNANLAAILVGAFQVIATFLSSLLIDKLGRRVLLLTSSFVMALSSVVLAIFFTFKDRTDFNLHYFGFIPILALCLFVVVFSIGLGPIPWMISSELFPTELKSIAGSTAGTFNWFLAFLITKFYLQVNVAIGQDTTFYLSGLVSVFGAVFVYFLVPETKGKSIGEIQAELEL